MTPRMSGVNKPTQYRRFLPSVLLVTISGVLAISMFGGSTLTNPLNSTDPTGTLSTYSIAGGVDQSNPFFQSLGTNGRSCGSCHVSSNAWSVSPPDLQARFASSNGFDPIFRPVDGANCGNNILDSVT